MQDSDAMRRENANSCLVIPGRCAASHDGAQNLEIPGPSLRDVPE
jgi:hypothetical protein